MLTTTELKARVQAELARCVEVINRIHNQQFTVPVVVYFNKGRTAGRASNYKWEIELHAPLLSQNPDELEPTVAHEFAHLADRKLHPTTRDSGIYMSRNGNFRRSKRSLHGTTWKSIMITLEHQPDRCHRMDTTTVRAKRTIKHMYKCEVCGQTGKVGGKIHGQIQRGETKRWFMKCHDISHALTKEGYMGAIIPPRAPIAVPGEPSIKPEAGKTKLQQVVELVRASSSLSRSLLIPIIMEKVNMSKAGASTYYQSAKKQIELERRAHR